MSESDGLLSAFRSLAPTGDKMAEELKIESELHSTMDFASARAQANRKALLALMAALRAEEDAIRLGAGQRRRRRSTARGRLTVRERLKLLLDEGTEFLELGCGRRMECMRSMAARPARASSQDWAASADGCA